MIKLVNQLCKLNVFKVKRKYLIVDTFNFNVCKNLVSYKSKDVIKNCPIMCRKKHSDNGIHSDQEDFDEIVVNSSLNQYNMKNIVTNFLDDPIIIKLNNCASVQELFDLVNSNSSKLQEFHISKAILVLWDLQVNFYNVNSIFICTPRKQKQTNSVSKNYIEQLISNTNFKNLLTLVKKNTTKFNEETLSCMILYLNYIGVNINDSLIQTMLDVFLKKVNEETSLSALSRVLVAVSNDESLRRVSYCTELLPVVEKNIDLCEDLNNFKLLTICLISCSDLIGVNLLEKYQRKLEDLFLNNKIRNDNHHQALLKIIIFLNKPCWNNSSITLINKCLTFIEKVLSKMQAQEAIVISDTVFKYHEPASILNQIQQLNLKLYNQLEEESMVAVEVQLKLLSSILRFSNVIHKSTLLRTLKASIPKCDSEIALLVMHKIIRFLQVQDKEISDKFWNFYMKFLSESKNFEDCDTVLSACKRYLHHGKALNYRNKKVEEKLLKYLLIHIERGILPLIPSKFSVAASFILPYSTNKFLIKNFIYKMEEMVSQLNLINYFLISKGINSALNLTQNKCVNEEDMKYLNCVLNNYIDTKALEINDTNSIIYAIKGSTYRSYFNIGIEEKMLKKLENNEIISAAIKNIGFCLKSRSILLPNLMNKITEHLIDKQYEIMGFNICIFMNLLFFLGYTPKKIDVFLPLAVDILIRDQERLSCLSYLQALLALCFFNKLPEFLIKQIFNVQFMERVDLELKNCNKKEIYPLRVRQNLFQLNRAVCLEYPESNVPWFHQKYLEENFKTKNLTSFQQDYNLNVLQYVLTIVQSNDVFKKDVKTPYGYIIDFVIFFDNDNNFVNEKNASRKLAVLLLKPYNYTRGEIIQLRGKEQMKIRHLEILGYEVVQVNFNEWKLLLTKEEKLNYLSNIILPNSEKQQLFT